MDRLVVFVFGGVGMVGLEGVEPLKVFARVGLIDVDGRVITGGGRVALIGGGIAVGIVVGRFGWAIKLAVFGLGGLLVGGIVGRFVIDFEGDVGFEFLRDALLKLHEGHLEDLHGLDHPRGQLHVLAHPHLLGGVKSHGLGRSVCGGVGGEGTC